ncbi:MAG: hypothetical protein K0R14_397 [Burkholderiales bacterium]|jgi:hypothetical protein|nr:hypothetical protein [Burkholderiales bacterium]
MKTKYSIISALFMGLFLFSGLACASNYLYIKVTCTFKDDKITPIEWGLINYEGRNMISSNTPIIGNVELKRVTNKLINNTYAVTEIALRKNGLFEGIFELSGFYGEFEYASDSKTEKWSPKFIIKDLDLDTYECTATPIEPKSFSDFFISHKFIGKVSKEPQATKITGLKNN